MLTGSNYIGVGFTGEFNDMVTNLVFLHARWYNPSSGTFLSRDPFAGYPTAPYSLHPYQYGYASPLLNTDHSGRCAVGGDDWCQPPTPCNYVSNPVPASCNVATPTTPAPYTDYDKLFRVVHHCYLPIVVMPATDALENVPDPRPARISYPALSNFGFVQGVMTSYALGFIGWGKGEERVYDYLDFEYAEFDTYAASLTTDLVNYGGSLYMGYVSGWSNYDRADVGNYGGVSVSISAGGSLPFSFAGIPSGIALSAFVTKDGNMTGVTWGVTSGNGFKPSFKPSGVSVSLGLVYAKMRGNTQQLFHGDSKAPTINQKNAFLSLVREHVDPINALLAEDIINTNYEAWQNPNGPISPEWWFRPKK